VQKELRQEIGPRSSGHALVENRNGLIVASTTDDYVEREAALLMLRSSAQLTPAAHHAGRGQGLQK
jgi:hypothetical protein